MPQTKDELLTRIAELETENRELKEQLAERSAVARASTEPGWLFTTRNPQYSGVVYGVKFDGGHGFLPMSRQNAEQTMRKIVSDFGYEVSEITAAEYHNLPAGQTKADTEREFLEKVSKPQVMN